MLLVMNHLTLLLNLPFTTIQQLVCKEPLLLAQDLPLLSASYHSLQQLWSSVAQPPDASGGQTLVSAQDAQLQQLLQKEPALLLLAPGRLQQVLQQQSDALGLHPWAWVAAVGRSPDLLRIMQGDGQGSVRVVQEEGYVAAQRRRQGLTQRFRALLLGGPWPPQKMLEVVEVEPRLLLMPEEVRSKCLPGYGD
jgi:hypothetical protein